MVAGRRKKEQTSWSDAYCTPRALAELLPYADVDPASNDRSWIRAAWAYSLEKGLDGLKLPWRGRVFLNWPYSDPTPWAEKALHEMTIGNCTDLIVLCKLDPSPGWWDIITTPVFGPVDRWDLDRRVPFEEPPEAIIERKRKRDEALLERERLRELAKQTGTKPPKVIIPPLKSSNNFASSIIHHRKPDAPALDLWNIATLWRKIPAPAEWAALPEIERWQQFARRAA